MESLLNLKHFLVEILAEIEPRAASASFVGSGAPTSATWSDCSDLDLVLIFSSASDSRSAVRALENCIEKQWRDQVEVVCGWGVVARHGSRANRLHLLVDSTSQYGGRSALFRRSTSKYPAILGAPLSDWSPKGQRTVQELLADWDGPLSWASRLAEQPLTIETPEWSERSMSFRRGRNSYATAIDEELYAVLHSVRNILRLLRASGGEGDLRELPMEWLAAKGPRGHFLSCAVEAKLQRRIGLMPRDWPGLEASRQFLMECCEFLQGVRQPGNL